MTSNVMDQIMDIIKTNIPVLIMTVNNNKEKNNILEILMPILVVPIILIIIKKISDNFNDFYKYLHDFLSNKYKNREKSFVIMRYYKKFYGKLIRDCDESNVFYERIMEYLTEKYADQLNELNTEQTKVISNKFIFGRRWNEEKPIKQIPLDKSFEIKINDFTYEIIHNLRTVKKVDLDGKDGNIKSVDYDNNYFEIKTDSHSAIKIFETHINEYFANQKPLIENFHLHKYNYYYIPVNKEGRMRSSSEIKITTKKSWDNIFLTKKEEEIIKNEIMNFIVSENQYELDGIPWKKGYLLYGEPGCGKTSLIYAIGWMTKRDIYSIDLSSIKTNSEFNNVVNVIPEKSIILFDDIDAHEISHCRKILAEKRKKEKEEINEYKNLMKSYYANKFCPNIELTDIRDPKDNADQKKEKDEKKNEDNDIDTKDSEKDQFTLDTVLSFLDGYSSLHGCIVIITTNRLDVLDSALIRPGRIDHKIKFKKCDFYQFKNIFKFFTEKDVPENFIFNEDKYTTSYIINTVVIPNRNNPELILDLVKN